MADDPRLALDDRAVRELFSDEDGPVGRYIRELCDEAAETARVLAPKDTGRLAGSIRVVMTHESDGTVYGVYGATAHADPPLSHPGWAAGYPYGLAFDNQQGFTWNRSPKGQPHTRGARMLHRFLTRAGELLAARTGG